MSTDKITRFEVIEETGRVYVRYGVQIDLSYQDGGRTLKVFVYERPDAAGLLHNRPAPTTGTLVAVKPRRVGAVKPRSQVKNPLTGTWTKLDVGKLRAAGFVEVKVNPKPFKGVRKEKGGD